VSGTTITHLATGRLLRLRHRAGWAVLPLVAAGIAACGTTVTVTVTALPVVPVTSTPPPAATATASPIPTPTPDQASTGGVVWPDAQVIITTCINHPAEPTETIIGAIGTIVTLTGTITNIGTSTNDYIVSIGIQGGSFNLGTADGFQVNSLAEGQIEGWSTTGYVTNNPTQPLTCSVEDVMSEPA
jgi:hypothetical protein